MRKRIKLSPIKENLIHELERQGKIYVEPNVLCKIDKSFRKMVPNYEEFRNIFYDQFEDFPESLLSFLANQKKGQIVITSNVVAGNYLRLKNIAQINPGAVVSQVGIFQEELIHLLDHLLGGRPDSLKIHLSNGHGINKRIRYLGKEIFALYKRGDAFYFYKYMGKNEKEYLAQSIRIYLQYGPDFVEDLDPLLYNMIKDRFLNEDFWREIL